MEIIYFTIIAGALYLISDRLLESFERWRGSRLKNRNIVFFVLLLGLSLASFALIRVVGG